MRSLDQYTKRSIDKITSDRTGSLFSGSRIRQLRIERHRSKSSAIEFYPIMETIASGSGHVGTRTLPVHVPVREHQES